MAKGLDVLLRVIGDASSGVEAMSESTEGVNAFKLGVVGAGAALAAFSVKIGGEALDAFEEFEAKMRNVQSVTRDSEESFQAMSEEVKQLANRDLIASVDEYASALYDVRSAGISAESSMATLDMIMKTSQATLTDSSDMAKIVTGAMNSYGESVVSASKISNNFTKVIARGVTTGAEMGQYFGKLTKLGAVAGVSIDELSASMSVLTRNNINTADAVTATQAVMNSFIKPSEALTGAVQKWGYESGAAALKALGMGGAMKKLAEETQGNMDAMGQLIPNIQGIKGAVVLASAGAKEFTEEIGIMAQESDEVGAALSKQTASFESTKNSLSQATEIMMTDIGQLLAEAITPFIKGLTEVIQAFNSMDKDVRDSYIKGAMKLIAGGVLLSGITGLSMALPALTTAATGAATAIGGMSLSLGAILAPLTAVAAGVYAVKKSFDALKKAQQADKAITNTIENFSEATKTISELSKKTSLNREETLKLIDAYKQAARHAGDNNNLRRRYAQQVKKLTSDLESYREEEEEIVIVQKARVKTQKVLTKEEKKELEKRKKEQKKARKEEEKAEEKRKNDLAKIRKELLKETKKLELDENAFKKWLLEEEYEDEKVHAENLGATDEDLKDLKKKFDLEIKKLEDDIRDEKEKKDKDAAKSEEERIKSIAKLKKDAIDTEKKNTLSSASYKLYKLREEYQANKQTLKDKGADEAAFIALKKAYELEYSKLEKELIAESEKITEDQAKKKKKALSDEEKAQKEAQQKMLDGIRNATSQASNFFGELINSENEAINGVGELGVAFSDLGNEASSALSMAFEGDIPGLIKTTLKEIGESIRDITRAWEEWNNATEDSILTREELGRTLYNNFAWIPFIGDALGTLSQKTYEASLNIGDYWADKQLGISDKQVENLNSMGGVIGSAWGNINLNSSYDAMRSSGGQSNTIIFKDPVVRDDTDLDRIANLAANKINNSYQRAY